MPRTIVGSARGRGGRSGDYGTRPDVLRIPELHHRMGGRRCNACKAHDEHDRQSERFVWMRGSIEQAGQAH